MRDLCRPETRARQRAMLSTAFGPAVNAALEDGSVMEVMVNPDGRLWIERHGTGRVDTGEQMSQANVERAIRLVASHMDRECDSERPIVSAELPETGERFEGVLPPVSVAPCFSIRKAAGRVFSLDDYVAAEIMTEPQSRTLRHAVRERMNIVIVGGTSSGKTTLANSLLAEIALSGDRIVMIEDTRELRCEAPDAVALRTTPGVVSLADLVRSTMRLRPDRIIVGEVRGAEALDMLKAWNTGHPGGVATLHANSARAGLYRLEQLIQEAVVAVPRELIADAIDCVVFIRGRNGARRVETVAAVRGLEAGDYALGDLDFNLVTAA